MNKIITSLFLLLTCTFINATHNRAGEILYKRIAPFTNVVGSVTVQVYTYSITVIRYTDDGSSVADRCVDTVHFGDGSKGVAPRINGLSNCGCGILNGNPITCGEIIVSEAGYKVKKNIYSIVHTYPGPGNYGVWSADPNRNQGIHNIPNSISIQFCIMATIVINQNTLNNSSPVLSNPPTDRAIAGQCFFVNMGAYDPDGDSLSYEVTQCRARAGQSIPGYFYPEIGPGGSYSINAVTGLLTWCTPQFLDDYSVAVIVKEWRKRSCNGTYDLMGTVMRDFEIKVFSGGISNTVHVQTLLDTCVKAGAVINRNFAVNSAAEVKIYGETSGFTSPGAGVNPAQISSPQVVTYSWQTQCNQARKKPYDVFVVTKNPANISRTYTQFKVTVLPPSPVLTTVVDTGFVKLNWQGLNSCLPDLEGYKIYRKTGTGNWSPSACQQGVPLSSGFVIIGSVSATSTSFTDNIYLYHDLVNGSQVQYIVVAYTRDCIESLPDNATGLTLMVGINEGKLEQNTSVYPNPFNQNLEIDLGGSSYTQLEISVYSMDGKLLHVEESANVSGKLNLSLNDLKSGIYTLILKTETGKMYKKIVKD